MIATIRLKTSHFADSIERRCSSSAKLRVSMVVVKSEEEFWSWRLLVELMGERTPQR